MILTKYARVASKVNLALRKSESSKERFQLKLPLCSKHIPNIHENLISSKLYQGATEYKVSSISGH